MKNKFFFLASVLLISLNNAKAMEEDHFQKTPKVLIVEIGKFLHGKDFFRFSRTCKNIRNTLSQHSKSFMPEEEEKALEIIEKTPFHQITSLLLDWERANKSKSIPLLSRLKDKFLDFYPPQENIYLELYRKNFETYIKILNLLYGVGDVKCEAIYKELYRKIESKFHVAIGSHEEENEFDYPIFYIFYYENYALLNSNMRENLLKKYQEGTLPFKKDSLKSEKYSKPFNLPLFQELFHK